MTSSDPDLAHRAAELVLHYDKTLSQAARILGCGVPTVQKFVQVYLDRQPDDVGSSFSDDPAFIPVVLADEASTDKEQAESSFTPTPIPIEIVTPSGLTLRLPLASLTDIAHLIHSLEVKPC